MITAKMAKMFHETFILDKPLALSLLSVRQRVGTCEAVAGVREGGGGVLGQPSEREGLADLEVDRPVGLRQDGARRHSGIDETKKKKKKRKNARRKAWNKKHSNKKKHAKSAAKALLSTPTPTHLTRESVG